MKKLIKSVFCSLAVIAALPICAKELNPLVIKETADTIVCRDFYGGSVTLHKNPEKVIIGYTSLVGAWYCAGGKAVAIPNTLEMNVSNLPKAARTLPRVGNFLNLNMEKIVSMKPDLVILSAFRCGQGTIDILKSSGIEYIVVQYTNYQEFYNVLDLFCHINDGSARTNAAAVKISSEVNKLCQKAAKQKSPRFISIFYTGRGLSCESSLANTAQIAKMLNGYNLIDEAADSIRGTRIPFSLEKIVMDNPDVILFTTMCDSEAARKELKKQVFSNPAWQEISAVRHNRVYFLPNRLFLYKANEHYPEAFRYMAKILYPWENWNK
ncbi:ABC transporter substrate-binding protein [Lentisphaerota bacterium ZTH]|nr:ABC transporter substrate-binding protein [Lentisphaerota bacterium]WET07539.1 ABC transporter substrate-binding protein [Lentisphaerota bacterium ZTH]